ncbi:nucleotide sugar dehydrogenase [Brachyspira hyodysenteriae]|uniref:UDP-glucose/GDP-mannose dehydrogenase n=1 Tax=Brachyspira hyodysenteriae (strain ATCC 49526 / WA1) TaxID=565034 RepID=A0A3B6VD51_BRAHW|nr:nucleotide sugar dehydrogenase [Brachyspira hyodysenteriae]ACN84163.1 UDP-glucose/GDP-mannose dehydrogenase [Brachyspira hyodysenteriae WA1]AUJ49892.1 nucleotide sugar dehydrogenase [Brachyspira hyodysenteriae]KLI16377.1 nucleotide sugar dehydrogenase [Brachyspira hyodysenteriae]KLI22724.1 nucleotide sugar dehydrogenase [Brachyspira hyodysenteriae]KLI33400.1 nucleotide sugar dehydrogenase [Brachyspira hyodysenteriae]
MYDVSVIGGLGHVGLPLSIALANEGKKVCIYDINEKVYNDVINGIIPFYEENMEDMLKKVLKDRTLSLSLKPDVIKDSKIVIIIVGTPVDEHLNPTFSNIKRMIDELVPYINNDQLIILRSTVYPGISSKIRDWFLEHNLTPDIAFCPERILEGKAMEELYNLPQIISSFTDKGLERARELFSLLTKDIIVLEPMEAEVTKLFTNVWRYIKFSVSNQFYMIANDYGLDFYKIYDAMTFNYPRTKDFPKAGFAAGPCLFKDSMQLGAFNNGNFYLGHTAMLINEGLPNYIVKSLSLKHNLKELTVGILGMAFKSESDDIRESLSYKLKKILSISSKKVLCSDPYVKDNDLISLEEIIEKSDILIIGAPHKIYKDINTNKKIVDVWNLLGNGGII